MARGDSPMMGWGWDGSDGGQLLFNASGYGQDVFYFKQARKLDRKAIAGCYCANTRLQVGGFLAITEK